jgi:endoglucanase
MTRMLLGALLLATPSVSAQTIALNQLGFEPHGPKIALIQSAATAPLDWRVVDAAGSIRLAGRSKPLGADSLSGQSLHLADFHDLTTSGQGYRLVVGNVASDPFAVQTGLYAPLAKDALTYFYHNRAGVPIEARFAGGPESARPAGHPKEVVGCFDGVDQKGNRWPGCDHKLDVTGGWYDAGDHGKYVVNGGIALWTLLNLYERYPGAFADGTLAIPEGRNGVSDLLDHARYQMEFMLKMQVPEGTTLKLPVGQSRNDKPLRFTPVNAGGMAHHKVADAKWTALPMRPDRDPEPRVLHAPGTAATLNLAATAAQCARIWRTIDPEFAARCLVAAERAWAAAVRNPDIFAVGDFAGSGSYDDGELSDEFYWAAAELFATTGDAAFAAVVRGSRHFAMVEGEPGWAATAPLGTLTLALQPNGLSAAEIDRLRNALVAAAAGFVAEREKVGMRIPQASQTYVWGSNGNLLNRAILLAAAHELTGGARFRDAAVDVMDYLLGRNPQRISYVSGYGTRAMKAPHHRFWAASLDPAYPPPPPGALSGGPNNSLMVDDVAGTMRGNCAPQACWADDARAYSLNEVAINWNAPLVWVSAWLASKP